MTATTFSIRRAVDADRIGICEVHVRAIREVCVQSYTSDQVAAWSASLTPANYERVIREHEFFVAEEERRIVGFGLLNVEKRGINAVYVLPDSLRQGVGAALLSQLEATARERGIEELELFATLNAVPFYERAGYLTHGKSIHRRSDGLELPCIHMTKRL